MCLGKKKKTVSENKGQIKRVGYSNGLVKKKQRIRLSIICRIVVVCTSIQINMLLLISVISIKLSRHHGHF